MIFRAIVLFLIFSVIQECSTSCTVNNGGCDGICTEVGFQTKCSCNILGTLQPDGKTCKYKGMIYYAHGNRIDFVYNSTLRIYVSNFPLTQINTVASDIESSKVFYAAVGSGMSIVGELSLHTLKQKNLTIEHGTVDGMAYNRTSKDLYYALVGGPVKVIRNVDGLIPNSELLLQMNKPGAIVLDSCSGYGFIQRHVKISRKPIKSSGFSYANRIFVSVRYIFISDWGSHEIVRYNPRFRSKVSIVTSGLVWPNALAIDTLTEKIFWADANQDTTTKDKIEMANYDGSCRKVIRVLPELHPFAMMFHGGYLYWTDWSRLNYKIYVTSIIYGTTSSFISLNYRPYGIDFFGELDEAIGKWSQWTETQSCPSNCIGRRERKRYCQNPYVHNYKKACLKTACQKSFKCVGSAGLEDGPQVESIVCDVCLCKVDGQWGPWSSGQCSQTCGTGRMTRSRYCNNPTPRNCGSDCTGTNTTIVDCYLRLCPEVLHGNWGAWSSYSACPVTCGGGIRTRTRLCNNPAPVNGGNICIGSNTQQLSCATSPCIVHGNWGGWSSYSACPVTCGGGIMTRTRLCNNPAPENGGNHCFGSGTEQQSCATSPCIEHGNWGEWSLYSVCPVTCGGGIRTRTRLCNNPAPVNGGNICIGSSTQQLNCSTSPCIVNGNWGAWSSYSVCSVTCGSGIKTKTRRCNNPAPANGGNNCIGNNTHQLSCAAAPCVPPANWGEWSSYSICSATCGYGFKTRTRLCNNPAPANSHDYCPGHNTEQLNCTTSRCTVHGNWGGWASYSACPVTCGGGIRRRTRLCNNPAPANGGNHCLGNNTEHLDCTTSPCKEKNSLMLIAGSSGGGSVFLVILVVICVCVKRHCGTSSPAPKNLDASPSCQNQYVNHGRRDTESISPYAVYNMYDTVQLDEFGYE